MSDDGIAIDHCRTRGARPTGRFGATPFNFLCAVCVEDRRRCAAGMLVRRPVPGRPCTGVQSDGDTKERATSAPRFPFRAQSYLFSAS